MVGAGDTYMLQLAFVTLPSPAVLQPAGQPVHGRAPDEFLYVPTGQGEQAKEAKEKLCPAGHDRFPINQLSTEAISLSSSLRLYTSTD